jgi:pantetheine-phosphate adenylyltransferase
MGQRIVMYPGTFDPLTFGHIDIIQRAARLGDHLIVAVAENAGKSPILSGDERCTLVATHLKGLIEADKLPDTVTVKQFSTLLTDFAASEGVTAVVRGLRAVSDFEYEFQMASINKRLHGELETIFMMAAEHQHFVASRFVKEVARYGGDISSFVPNDIALALQAKLRG